MRDDDHNTLETRIAVHEAVCAERYGKILDRVTRVEMVLYAIVALLLVGEGSVIDVLRRLLG
jgi:hypothetical protein